MLDLAMVAILLACCGLIYLLIRWCEKQVDSREGGNKHDRLGNYCTVLGRVSRICARTSGKILVPV